MIFENFPNFKTNTSGRNKLGYCLYISLQSGTYLNMDELKLSKLYLIWGLM
jgi:hypothetical protein